MLDDLLCCIKGCTDKAEVTIRKQTGVMMPDYRPMYGYRMVCKRHAERKNMRNLNQDGWEIVEANDEQP
jgi:hypothetical protein